MTQQACTPQSVATGRGWTMYLGDCVDVMQTIGDVDALITDPPYGIGLGSHGGAAPNRTGHVLIKKGYASHDDDPEKFGEVAERIEAAIAKAGRAAVFMMGRQFRMMPEPDAVGGIHLPSAVGRSLWGFTSLAPILFYGRAPSRVGSRPTVHVSTEVVDKDIDHPVPKPIGWMLWLVGLASAEGETVLDPFAGSGTTGVACLRLGRSFIGIEKESKYFDLACERLRAEEGSTTIQAARAGQASLFGIERP